MENGHRGNGKLLTYERDALAEEEVKTRPNMIKYRRIISAFKYKWPIPDELEDTLIEYLKATKRSSDEINEVREIIRQQNQILKNPNYKVSDTVILMLEKKYEPIPLVENPDLEKRLKGDLEYYRQYFIDGDENVDLLPDESNYDLDKLEYIYKRLINMVVDIINDICEEMKLYETYDDEAYRKLIIADYNNAVSKYNRLIDKYRKEVGKEEAEVIETEESEEIDETPKSKLLFLRKPGSERIYLMDDAKYITKQNYERVCKLLTGLRYDRLTEANYGGFVGHNKIDDYEELKDDQVRIIYRDLGNNEYLIMGMFTKKENRSSTKVEYCAKRYIYATD